MTSRVSTCLLAAALSFCSYGQFGRPINDDFVHRSHLFSSGGAMEVNGATTGSTLEPGEPQNRGAIGSVWFDWTPDRTGLLQFSGGFGGKPDIAFFRTTGPSFSDLQLISTNIDETYVFAGTTYYIACYWHPGDNRPLAFRISTADTPPVNDNFAQAIPIEFQNGIGRVTGTTLGATREPDEPFNAGWLDSEFDWLRSTPMGAASASVWYKWTPAVSEEILIGFDNSFADVSAFRADGEGFAGLKKIATRYQSYYFEAGKTYYFAVYNDPYGFTLLLSHPLPPPQDNFREAYGFGGAIQLPGATLEPGEPHPDGSTASIWFKVGQPGFSRLNFETGNTIDVEYTLYAGLSVDRLVRIDPPEMIPGQTYYVAATDKGGSRINFAPTTSFYPTPTGPHQAPNDERTNAIVISGKDHVLTTANWGVNSQVEKYQRSLWWKYIPPESGDLLIYVVGLGNCTIWEEQAPGTLEPVSVVRAYLSQTLSVRTGGVYYVEVNATAPFEPVFAGVGLTLNKASNDDFENAFPVTENTSIFGSNLGASSQLDEPRTNAKGMGASVWYSWIAPYDGMADVRFEDRDYTTDDDSFIAVYRGQTLKGLDRISDGPFVVKNGEKYFFQIDTFFFTHAFHFRILSSTTKPANDDFENAPELSGLSFSAEADITLATAEPGEWTPFGGNAGWFSSPQSVWWRYKTPEDGGLMTLRMMTTPTQDAMIFVAQGTNIKQLRTAGPWIRGMYVQPNSEFLIGITARGGSSCKVYLNGFFSPGPDRRVPQELFFPPIGDVFVDAPPFRVPVSTDAGLPVDLSVVAGPAKINGDILTVTGPGYVVVRAEQIGNDNFYGIGRDSSFLVRKYSQKIEFEPPDQFGEARPLKAKTSTGLPVRFEVVKGSGQILNGDTLVNIGEGELTIRAVQDGNALFYPAQADQKIWGNRFSQTVRIFAVPGPSLNSSEITLVGVASSSLPVSFTVDSGPGVLSGNTLTMTSEGEVTVIATQKGDSVFQPASASRTFLNGRPTLFANLDDDTFSLTWAKAYSGFILEGAQSVSGPWKDLSTPGDPPEVRVRVPGDTFFLRLIHP